MFRFLTLALAASSVAAFTSPARPQTALSTSTASSSLIASSPSALQATGVLKDMDLPEKLYKPKSKEFPKVLGGLKIGLREICVITGASSGLGLYTALALAKTGKYFLVLAVRDVEKMKKGK